MRFRNRNSKFNVGATLPGALLSSHQTIYNMKKFQILMSLVLLTWTLGAQNPIEDAKKKIVNENFNEAKKILNAYVGTEKDPKKLGEAYFWLGEADYANLIDSKPGEALTLAREQFNKGLLADKNCTQCLVGMGKLLLDQKNNKEAAKTFDQAIRNSREKRYREGSPEIYMMIGDCYIESTQKNPEIAVSNYTRARDIEPKNATYWIHLGDAQLLKGDAGSAVSAWETGAEKDKTNPEVYAKMAEVWKRANKLDLAIQQCLEGIKVDNQYAPLYKKLAELYADNKQYDKVTGTLDSYLKLVGDQDPEARLRFFKYLTYQVRDYDRVLNEGSTFAAKFGDKYPTIYRWLTWSGVENAARLEKDTKDSARIIKLYTDAVANSTKLMTALPADRLVDYDYNYRARAEAKLGNVEGATKMYSEVMKIDTSKKCSILSDLIKMNYDARKYKEGLDLFDERAKSCDLKSLDIFYAMYWAQSSKQYARAIIYSDAYLAKVPDGADGYLYKAISINELDTSNTFAARETYEKLIALAEKGDARAKSFVPRAYNYLGSYYGSINDLVKAKEYFQKTLAIDPADKFALSSMQQLGN